MCSRTSWYYQFVIMVSNCILYTVLSLTSAPAVISATALISAPPLLWAAPLKGSMTYGIAQGGSESTLLAGLSDPLAGLSDYVAVISDSYSFMWYHRSSTPLGLCPITIISNGAQGTADQIMVD